MLAMVVNADAGSLTPPGVLGFFFASMLAPTGGLWQPQAETNGPMYY